MVRGLLLTGYVGLMAAGGGVASLLSPSVDLEESGESIRLRGVEEPGVLERGYGLEVVAVAESPYRLRERASGSETSSLCAVAVSYTHLTLPTIYSV